MELTLKRLLIFVIPLKLPLYLVIKEEIILASSLSDDVKENFVLTKLYFKLPSYVEIAGNIDKSIPTSTEANERVVIRIKTIREGITFFIVHPYLLKNLSVNTPFASRFWSNFISLVIISVAVLFATVLIFMW